MQSRPRPRARYVVPALALLSGALLATPAVAHGPAGTLEPASILAPAALDTSTTSTPQATVLEGDATMLRFAGLTTGTTYVAATADRVVNVLTSSDSRLSFAYIARLGDPGDHTLRLYDVGDGAAWRASFAGVDGPEREQAQLTFLQGLTPLAAAVDLTVQDRGGPDLRFWGTGISETVPLEPYNLGSYRSFEFPLPRLDLRAAEPAPADDPYRWRVLRDGMEYTPWTDLDVEPLYRYFYVSDDVVRPDGSEESVYQFPTGLVAGEVTFWPDNAWAGTTVRFEVAGNGWAESYEMEVLRPTARIDGVAGNDVPADTAFHVEFDRFSEVPMSVPVYLSSTGGDRTLTLLRPTSYGYQDITAAAQTTYAFHLVSLPFGLQDEYQGLFEDPDTTQGDLACYLTEHGTLPLAEPFEVRSGGGDPDGSPVTTEDITAALAAACPAPEPPTGGGGGGTPNPVPTATPSPEPTPDPTPEPSPTRGVHPAIGDPDEWAVLDSAPDMGSGTDQFYFRAQAPAPFSAIPAGTAHCQVFVGDWDGDGIDTVGYREHNSFHLADSNAPGAAFTRVDFGDPADVVHIGDWDGDGIDTPGVRRGNAFLLSNSFDGGAADIETAYGWATDAVLVGDWDGDGTDTPGVWRDRNTFLAKDDFNGGRADRVTDYGRPTDELLIGDWDGDGTDTPGVRRGNAFHLKNDWSGGTADREFTYGLPTDKALTGHFANAGKDFIGVYRAR